MAPDERLNDVLVMVTDHLAADAALTIATIAEPGDDAYLAAHERAQSFYAPGSGLVPISGRFAVPGGRVPDERLASPAGVAPAPVFGVGLQGDDVVALVGSPRDASGRRIAEAFLVRRSAGNPGSWADGRWQIVGRAAREPLTDDVVFEPLGGQELDPAQVTETRVVREPGDPADAQYLRGWGRP